MRVSLKRSIEMKEVIQSLRQPKLPIFIGMWAAKKVRAVGFTELGKHKASRLSQQGGVLVAEYVGRNPKDRRENLYKITFEPTWIWD